MRYGVLECSTDSLESVKNAVEAVQTASSFVVIWLLEGHPPLLYLSR